MKIAQGYLLALLLLLTPFVHAGESATAVKADDLRSEPFRDAKSIGSLTTGDTVEILGKDGGWLKVKSSKGNGWVRMLSVRRGAARHSSGTSVAGLAGLASGRSATGRVVATTGIRGLNEEDLKLAKYNEEELKTAESYLTSSADAAKFAAQGKLHAQKLDYLPEPSNGGAR